MMIPISFSDTNDGTWTLMDDAKKYHLKGRGIFYDLIYFLIFFCKVTYLEAILCKKSIPRIPEAWKRFLDPDSGNGVDVLKRKSNIFGFLWENRQFLGFSRRESIARIPEAWKRFLNPDSGKELVYWSEINNNPKMFDFRLNTPISSLNQGQGSVFTLRECA